MFSLRVVLRRGISPGVCMYMHTKQKYSQDKQFAYMLNFLGINKKDLQQLEELMENNSYLNKKSKRGSV